jgi:hypothetical protein
MTFTLTRLVMAAIWISSANKWGDSKNWRKYYPTMLFFGMGDLIYHVTFYEKPLWLFELDFIAFPLNELFITFAIFCPTTILFLSNYPEKSLSHKALYIIFWILLYVGIEIFTALINMFTYHNGWNLWWSVLHNAVQFPLLIIHHKKPALAWIIALVFLFFIMYVFKVPFTISK